jgi:hypothetical protein
VVKYGLRAEVAEQADALRSGRSGLYAHVGSTPTFGMESRLGKAGIFLSQLVGHSRLDIFGWLRYTGDGGFDERR